MKNAFRLGLGAALAALLMWLAMRGVDGPALATAIGRARPFDMVLVVLLTVAMYWVRAARWRLLLPPLREARLLDLFSITNIGFMAGLAIPRAGEILRPYLASRRYGVPVTAGFASIVLERLMDLVTVLFLLFAYMFVLPRPAMERSDAIMDTLRVGAAVAFLSALAGFGFLAALRVKDGFAQRLLGRGLGLLPASVGTKVRGLVDSFIAGLDVFGSSTAQWARLAGESLLLWLLIALIIHRNSMAFGFAIPFHTAFLIIAFLTVGVAIPTPGMVGGFHASYTLALTAIYGIPRDQTVAAGLVLHALQNIPVLILGLAFLGREGLSFSSVRRITAERDEEKSPGVEAAAAVREK